MYKCQGKEDWKTERQEESEGRRKRGEKKLRKQEGRVEEEEEKQKKNNKRRTTSLEMKARKLKQEGRERRGTRTDGNDNKGT